MLYDLADVQQHIVDLNRTPWDKERSVREKGIYHFTGPKVYIKKSDYEDSASRPKHILKFISKEDSLPHYRAKFGAEPVTINDQYWPEPMVPNAEGQYVIIDAILVKIANMEDYIDFRIADRQKGKVGHEQEDANFNARAISEGVELDTDRMKR
jgi:hypothetical protein